LSVSGLGRLEVILVTVILLRSLVDAVLPLLPGSRHIIAITGVAVSLLLPGSRHITAITGVAVLLLLPGPLRPAWARCAVAPNPRFYCYHCTGALALSALPRFRPAARTRVRKSSGGQPHAAAFGCKGRRQREGGREGARERGGKERREGVREEESERAIGTER